MDMTDVSRSTTDHHALRLSEERPASTFSGYPVLLVVLLSLVAEIIGFGLLPNTPVEGVPMAAVANLLLIVGAGIVFLVSICGFYLLQPNQAAAMLLFGTYKGTDRTTGLRWRWP